MSAPPSPPSTLCYAPAGWYCSPQGVYVPCPSNSYCQGGAWPPLACPENKYAPAASAHLEDCTVSMYNNATVVFFLLAMLVVLWFCVFLCCDYLQFIARCPDPECDVHYKCRPNEAQFRGHPSRIIPVQGFPVYRV